MADEVKPSPNGSGTGRGGATRFKPGNPGGPGNPLAKKVATLRKALFEAITAEELRSIIKNLIGVSKGDDAPAVAAAKLLLGYAVGQPQAYVEITGPGGGPVLTLTGDEAIGKLEEVLAREAARAEAEEGHR